MKKFVEEFLAKELDNYLHRNPTVAEALRKRIEQSERERKELAGIKKLGINPLAKSHFSCLMDHPMQMGKSILDMLLIKS